MGPAHGGRRPDHRADRRPGGRHRRADRIPAHGRVPRVHRRFPPRLAEAVHRIPGVNRRALAGLAVVVGIALIAIAIVYWAEPAKSLPSFFPGHQAGSSHHHTKHGIASFLVGLACFAFAWFNTGPKKSRTA